MTKIKMTFILPTLQAGGAERVLITLMNGLGRARFAPELIVLNGSGPLRGWIAGDIPVHALGGLRIKNGLFRLAAKLNEIRPDIVVSTMAGMNFGVLLAAPFLKKKAKIIIREAVVPSSIIDAQKMPWLVRAAYRILYPRADKILAPAGCIIEELKNDLGLRGLDYALLHNPVDIGRLREGAPAPRRAGTVHFICAGRLHKQKGFDRLIESLPGMKTDIPWRLQILGTGPEHNALSMLIRKKKLADRVELAGLAENPWKLIGAADALLLPSRWEGLPNVALEALAVGTPVIALRSAGGIDEIAALSPPGAVTVAEDMREFLKAMEKIQPRPQSTVYRTPLLPEYFHLENVIRRFEDLLPG